jgi:hypothetical protein
MRTQSCADNYAKYRLKDVPLHITLQLRTEIPPKYRILPDLAPNSKKNPRVFLDLWLRRAVCGVLQSLILGGGEGFYSVFYPSSRRTFGIDTRCTGDEGNRTLISAMRPRRAPVTPRPQKSCFYLRTLFYPAYQCFIFSTVPIVILFVKRLFQLRVD